MCRCIFYIFCILVYINKNSRVLQFTDAHQQNGKPVHFREGSPMDRMPFLPPDRPVPPGMRDRLPHPMDRPFPPDLPPHMHPADRDRPEFRRPPSDLRGPPSDLRGPPHPDDRRSPPGE